jgi:hypothetical protein
MAEGESKMKALLARICFAIVLLIAALWPVALAYFSRAGAHEAAPGWAYDAECCSGMDCAPVLKAESSALYTAHSLVPPTLTVTTIHGTAEVPANMKRRESKDHRMHACIVAGQLICLYMPPGS